MMFVNNKIGTQVIKIFYILVLFMLFSGRSFAVTKMIEQPAISKDHLAFIYAGDIWLSNHDGSQPVRLTANLASESAPHFSPDGQTLAYTSNHDGNYDVYTISIKGGQPKRLTWHPGKDAVNGWNKAGTKILFTSRREMKQGRSAQAWEISVEGGYPTKVMEAVVQSASWSPTGKLAFQPYITAHGGASGWRNHRGGSTPPIWLLTPGEKDFEEIPHLNASDTNPIWVDNQVYFLSDRNKVRNVYKYDSKSKTVTQISNEKVWDVSSVNSFEHLVVYEVAGELKIIDVKTDNIEHIKISISPELPELRVQWKNAMKSLESFQLSPTGKNVLLSARGDVFTVAIENAVSRNLTMTSGIRERDAIWSPLNTDVAYTSDESGKQNIIIQSLVGSKKIRQFELGPPADYKLELWGGDASKIIYTDNHLTLWSIDVTTGERIKITVNNRRDNMFLSLSKDGKWLAYTKSQANYLSDIYLYDMRKKASFMLSNGMTHIGGVSFSPSGKYLIFTASTNALHHAGGGDMSALDRSKRYGIYAAVLSEQEKSPLWVPSKNDYVDIQPSIKDNKNNKETVVNIKGIKNRIVALPVEQRNYSNLRVAYDGSVFYLDTKQPGISIGIDGQRHKKKTLFRFNFKTRKAEKVIDDINSFEMSHNGKSMIAKLNNGKIKTATIKNSLEFTMLNTANVKIKVDPKKEWEQIFDEVWRTEEQYFYDENFHGLDWKATREHFKELLPHIGRREDLNRLMVEMIAQMEVGHNRIFGGDLIAPSKISVGLLGANFSIVNNQYKISNIFSGESWNPSLKAPLNVPGLGIIKNDVIHSINSTKLHPGINIYSLLENTVGQQVTLQVSHNGKISDAREVVVVPIESERELRLWDWVESNRKRVNEASEGRIAYVYIPDTDYDGFDSFNRMFAAQSDKKAVILDERGNSGGKIPNYIIDILSRQYMASGKDRVGLLFDTPTIGIYGPKVMLIDQDAGSGGDFLPYSFKRSKLGTLIGKTTWGGVIAIAANRQTIDGGIVLVPYVRLFTPEKEWRIENEGVAPDIDIPLDPVKVNLGEDSQLEFSINHTLKQLEKYKPLKVMKAPSYPIRLGQ